MQPLPNSSVKNHFIEHKQAYMAAAITVLALAVIAAVVGTLGLLATEGVSLGFLSSLNEMGSIGSISMLGAGGALTLLAATALGLLTTSKKGQKTLIQENTSSSSSGTEGVKSLMIEKLTDEDYKKLSPFLHRGEYIEFQEREFKDIDDGIFTRQARYTKAHQTNNSLRFFKVFEVLGEYANYTLVSLETLRERKTQFDKRTENVLTIEGLLNRVRSMNEGEYHLCADLNYEEDESTVYIGIVRFKIDDQLDVAGGKNSVSYITGYRDIRDKYSDYTSVSTEELKQRAKTAVK